MLGVLAGSAAWVLIKSIGVVTNAALYQRWGTTLPSFASDPPGVAVVPAAVIGGLLIGLLALWAPVIKGHGIPEAMESVLTRHSRISPRTAIAKPLSAAIAIGTGGPFGAEGPIVVTGGALGSLAGQLLRMSPNERKVLLAAGAAAGMAATFGTPLAAVVLAVELLLFEYTTRAVVPLIVAAAIGAGMHSALFGVGPVFAVSAHPYEGLGHLWVFVIVGLGSGLLAVVVVRGLHAVERGYERLPIPAFWHPALGGLGFALIGLAVPRALGVGYGAIDDVLANRLAVGTVAVLLVAKLVMWWVALGSGTSGGTLAPLLLIGSSFGALAAAGITEVFPHSGVSPTAVAVVAMAALFGAAIRAPFTAIVFAYELTLDLRVVIPLMLAVVLADLVARALLDHGLMTGKLARRGLRVPAAYTPDVFAHCTVGEVMTREVFTVPDDVAVETATTVLVSSGHGALPVVDTQGRCVGVLTRGDLLRDGTDRSAPVTTVAAGDPVTIAPDELLQAALERMMEQRVEHLPVITDDGRLVGICTRTDLLRAQAGVIEAERPQDGWARTPSTGRSFRSLRPGARQ